MKKLFLALMIMLVTLFAITSCGKDNENDPAPEVQKFPEGSVVWLDSTTVSIIPAEGVTRDDVASLKAALDEVIDTAYISSVYAEKTEYEIIVGYIEDREVSVKAYRLLERMQKDSYFDARYVIYAKDNSVGIAYDENEYTTLQARDYAINYFIENYVEGREYIAFGAGNRVEERVDLIEEQEVLDGIKMSEAWDRLFIEAGGETNPERAAAIVDAFKSWHGVYDKNVVGWYANLYDPVTGGFYISNSGRNVDGFLPDIESTVQALNAIASLGMADHVGGEWAQVVPDWMRNQLIAFAKGLQSSKNGYFYHPQWTQEMVDNKISRRGRDLGWATSLLGAFGSAPTYNAPNGTKGDGVTVEEFWESVDWYGYMGELPEETPSETSLMISLGGSTASAVSKVIAASSVQLTANDNTDYLANHENFYNYMWSLPLTDGMSYTIGNDFNATRSQIKAKSKALGKYTEDPSKPYYNMTLCDIWVDYFNAKVNPENGLWEKTANFAGTNGFMKLNSSYTDFGAPLPYPMEAAESCIKGLTSSEDPSHVCHNYNLWVSLNGIKSNVETCYADDPETRDAVLDYIQEALLDGAVDMINKTRERVSKFQNEDGGFRYHHNMNGGSSQGMPVSLNVAESGINATSICMGGNWTNCFNAFGFTKISIFGEADAMRYIETLEGLGPVQKYDAEPVTVDFEDGVLPAYFVPMRGGTLDIVEFDGSNRLVMGHGTGEAGKTWPGMDITKTSAANSGDYMVIEGDFTFCNEADGYYEFYINSDDSKSVKPMYFQFHMNGNTISVKDVRLGSGKSFVVGTRGKTFHLRLEYFLNSKGQSALRINSDGKYLGTITNTGTNTTFVGGAAPTRLSRLEFAGSYKNGGLIYVDNFNFGPELYVDEDGDESPDKFPDNEGAQGGIEVDGGMGSPVNFEKIAAVDPAVIKPASATASAIVDHNGSKALELTFTADSNDEVFIYKTKAAEADADTLVFEADMTPNIEGQFSLRFRISSSIAYSFTINGKGAYDGDGSWQPNFAEPKTTIHIRMEYGAVESEGKTYMQTKIYVDGELKLQSKLIDKYLASDSNGIRNITAFQIAENGKSGEGKLYLDNVEYAEVVNTNVTLPENVVDEDGFVKFENMSAIDASIAKAKSEGSLTVGDQGDKKAMIFEYKKSRGEEFTLYPTKSEAGADTLTLEANVTDSYGSPRFLKIYAGSRVVYDFRINGAGGIASESNNVWWGSGHYKVDETYNFKVIITVTEGKVDLKLYINGTEVKRPSAYGTKLDLTADAGLIEDISHITITDNEQANTVDTGKIYLTDYRFTKTDEIEEGADTPVEPPHEHVYVDGKCECGAADPDYVPDEGGDAPEEPKDYAEYYHDFEDIDAISTSIIRPGSTGTVITVGEYNGSGVAAFEFLDTKWDEVLFQPTYKDTDPNAIVYEADFTFDVNYGSGNYITFYFRGGSSQKPYSLNFNALETGFSANDNLGFSKADAVSGKSFKLRIEYKEISVDGAAMIKVRTYINGDLVAECEPFAKTADNAPSAINRIDIMGSLTIGGKVYVDNYAFLRIAGELEKIETPGAGGDTPVEPPHEHVYVEGKCECGAADPDYVPPVTDKKGIKILFFGNSYSVDATKWLSKIFLEAGYTDVVIGNVATGGCCINEHWSFLDGIEGNEPNNGAFFYAKFVNGSEVSTPDDYAYAIADEDWDIISIQHAPDELKQIDTYSHLQDFLDYIFARTTNEDVKLVFHMIWAHNNTSDTVGLYNSILRITDTYVTSNSAFDGLIPSATMIQYLRDHGLTDATKDDAGNWTAGDITRDWGHMNFGLGRYAIGLLYYAYLTGESIDDITWVPTPDMVAGTSEATGFAEIDAEKLALIKAAIKYALANPYGEDYTPSNGDGIGFPDCEMGGGNSGTKPLTPDANGVISFEDMTAEGSLLVIPTIAGTTVVVDRGGSKQLEMKYTADSTEKFKFTPTLKQSGADEMIFEADLTDCYGKPRTFTIYAGTTKVYDFRINGEGGFAAEGNGVWWGGGKYTLETPYKLKITAKVTDGKLDLNLYINDELATRPSAYGTKLDLTAADNLIELITHIEIEDGTTIASASAGSVYADNLKFALLDTASAPVEPPHEHVYVDGKCECGAADPDYVPEGEKDYSEYYLSFDGVAEISTSFIRPGSTGTVITVGEYNGSGVAAFEFLDTKWDEVLFQPTYKDTDPNAIVYEADFTFDVNYGSGNYITFYFRGGSSQKPYSLNFNALETGFSANDNLGFSKADAVSGKSFKLRIEYKEISVDGAAMIKVRTYINGDLVAECEPFAKTADNAPSAINRIDIMGSLTIGGKVYVDNYAFLRIAGELEKIETPGAGGDTPVEPPHEHEFVDGKCECGEADPDYVAPSTPDIRDGAITFEDIESLGAVGISVSNSEAIVVSPLAGGKALKVDFAADATEKITITPNTVEGADKFVFEVDITNMDAADTVSTDKAQYDIKFYSLGSPEAANGTLYDFRLNGATFMCEYGGQWLGSVLPADDTTFRLTIELWVEGEALCMNVLVDGNEVARKSQVYGKSYTHVASGMSASTISSIYKVEIVDSRGTANGTVYFDNIYCAAIKSAE